VNIDLFDFWADVPADAREHPADKKVLDRAPHSFEMGCLPGPYIGPLRVAKVVFLFLSPGFDPKDIEVARSDEGQAHCKAQRTGSASLPSHIEHQAVWLWCNKKIGKLGIDLSKAAGQIAFLNINAYHSKSFTDWHMLAALPSSRVCLSWAQSILFPQAEAGERVVVCLRSANHWGLRYSHREGKLFAPPVNRAGHMLHGDLRLTVKEAVARALSG
jgi:hypothetical protein